MSACPAIGAFRALPAIEGKDVGCYFCRRIPRLQRTERWRLTQLSALFDDQTLPLPLVHKSGALTLIIDEGRDRS